MVVVNLVFVCTVLCYSCMNKYWHIILGCNLLWHILTSSMDKVSALQPQSLSDTGMLICIVSLLFLLLHKHFVITVIVA